MANKSRPKQVMFRLSEEEAEKLQRKKMAREVL